MRISDVTPHLSRGWATVATVIALLSYTAPGPSGRVMAGCAVIIALLNLARALHLGLLAHRDR